MSLTSSVISFISRSVGQFLHFLGHSWNTAGRFIQGTIMILSGTANLSFPSQLIGLIALRRFEDYIESTNLLVDGFC